MARVLPQQAFSTARTQYQKSLAESVGRDRSVGIAARYELDGPGIESQWERDFPHPSIPALDPTQPPIQWVPRVSRG